MAVFDANMDDKMNMDEHVLLLKTLNHTNIAADKESFWVAYHKTGGVPLDKVVNYWFRFKTASTRTTANEAIDDAIRTAMKP